MKTTVTIVVVLAIAAIAYYMWKQKAATPAKPAVAFTTPSVQTGPPAGSTVLSTGATISPAGKPSNDK